MSVREIEVTEKRIVPPPSDPMAVARAFAAENYLGIGGTLLLRHHRNRFHRYTGDHWPEDDERRVSSELWQWLEDAVFEKVVKDELTLFPFEPTRYKIQNVLEALKAIGHVPEAVQHPVWLAEEVGDAVGVIPVANGILDLLTRTLRPHTPELFSPHVLGFEYDPKADPPSRWLRFLDELFQDDEEAKAALGEWFGYVLAGGTELQKMLLVVGPKRSGKGTLARVLTGLLGAHNVAAPTLAGLTGNFGLQVLVGKPLAIVSDARLGSRADTTIAVERLLSISGEDTITIDRKYRDPWTGRLPSRFMILTNEIPRFADASGALASRFVMLILTTRFYGRENPRLTDELLAEAPGIFNWALAGLDRLHERGYFLAPDSAREAQRHLEDLASPAAAFVRDLCVVGPAFEVSKDDLWDSWKAWCQDEGRDRPGTKAVFARDLRATVPGLTPIRRRDGDERVHAWRGLILRKQWVGPLTTPDQDDSSVNGQGSGEPEISLNHAGGQGWSGMERIVFQRCVVCDSDFEPDEAHTLRCASCTERSA